MVERLAVPMETLGFDSEATMVESLAALVSSANGSANGSMQTCFAPGAGESQFYTTIGLVLVARFNIMLSFQAKL